VVSRLRLTLDEVASEVQVDVDVEFDVDVEVAVEVDAQVELDIACSANTMVQYSVTKLVGRVSTPSQSQSCARLFADNLKLL
jgi:hypothetical protein